MKSANWISLVLCGLVAGMVWHLLSAAFLAALMPELVVSAGRNAPHHPLGGLFFYGIDLAMGIWAVWLYSAIVPRYGVGPKTVGIAAAAWWVMKTLQSAKWAGLGFIDISANLLPVGAATLVSAMIASAVGVWLLRKSSEMSTRELPAETEG